MVKTQNLEEQKLGRECRRYVPKGWVQTCTYMEIAQQTHSLVYELKTLTFKNQQHPKAHPLISTDPHCLSPLCKSQDDRHRQIKLYLPNTQTELLPVKALLLGSISRWEVKGKQLPSLTSDNFSAWVSIFQSVFHPEFCKEN